MRYGPTNLNLSDTYSKQAQNNAVFPTQEEMDRVGVEPTTTSAMPCKERIATL
ncbi:MAG TPA: hypothetical protein VKA87_00455 [Nitrososphaeraceae archaeon]|nr:hypothetical protein [Nitrososphaeraceae archaeon]